MVSPVLSWPYVGPMDKKLPSYKYYYPLSQGTVVVQCSVELASKHSRLHSCFDWHCLPDVQFAWHPHLGRKLTRLLLRKNGAVAKELMDVELLSPPSSLHVPRIYPSTSLLLATRTVAYPLPRGCSALDKFEPRWTQAMIPKQYIQLFGVPLVAAFAPTYGRSVAVASSRGICVLECSGPPGAVAARVSHAGRTNPRWHLFANTCDERSFRVVSFTWCEQVMNHE